MAGTDSGNLEVKSIDILSFMICELQMGATFTKKQGHIIVCIASTGIGVSITFSSVEQLRRNLKFGHLIVETLK